MEYLYGLYLEYYTLMKFRYILYTVCLLLQYNCSNDNNVVYYTSLYDENYYLVSEAENPKGPESTPMERRVIRGGSWMSFKHFLRVALRNYQNPEIKNNYTGFRCVVDLN